MLPFRSLDPFRPLREPDRRRRDEERLSRSEQRTANKPKDHLTGKAPYRFESSSLQRRVVQTSFRPPALVTSDSGRAGGAEVLMAGEGIYDMTLQFQRCHRQQGGADRQDPQDYLSWRR